MTAERESTEKAAWFSARKATILCVEEDERNRNFLEASLSERGYEVILSGSGQEALEIVRERQDLDLVLVDGSLTEMTGIEVCERIRSFPRTRYVPVVLATARPTTAERDPDPDTGADDYVSKPYLRREMLARIHTLLRIKSLEDEILRLSTTDLLTGLSNRSYLAVRLDEELSRARRYSTPISCFLVSIDNLKGVREAFGNLFGDRVVQEFGHILTSRVRREDVFGIWRNEEFFAILPESNENGAFVLAERIRSAVEATWFEYDGLSTRITLSVGVTGYTELPAEMNVERFAREAEVALGHSRKKGGGRVLAYSQLVAS